MKRYKGSMRSGGAVGWFLQRLTAVILFVGLAWHWLLLHHLGTGEVSYETALERIMSPGYRTAEMVFLLVIIYHAMNGVLAIVRDYDLKPWIRGTAWSLAVAVGLFLAVFGSMTILSFNIPFVG